MNKGLSIAALAVAGVVALTACEGGSTETVYYKNGPAGTIKEKEVEGSYYELEVVTANGKKKEFNVTSSVYFDCYVGAYYPSCVKSPKVNVKPSGTKAPAKNNDTKVLKQEGGKKKEGNKERKGGTRTAQKQGSSTSSKKK
jgi:hypothetical protein